MSTTDNRIVRMVFDNAAFKRAAAETKSALDKVNVAITKAGQSKGLLNLNSNMKEVAINASKMQVATAAAIGTIASKATIAGTNMIKSLTFDPIKEGFNEYGELLTKQNAIMNSTGKDADTVKAVLNDLNKYSDKTIFKFADMTQALTKFTNAGIGLKRSSEIIKGVGNAAAFAGLTTEKAGAAFYAVAQVMETGFLQGNDLMQLNNAGFATTKFKEEVVKAAAGLGTLRKQGDHYVTKTGKYVSATKGFKDNLKEQWATAEAVNIALAKYNDQSTEFGRKAFDSATKVRTFSAFMGTLKESLASGWAQVFSAMFGGLEDATNMWTKLSLAVGTVVSGFFNFLEASLAVWREMGGATKIGQAIQNVFSPFVALFKAIGDAWRTAFGGEGGKGAGSTLYGISVALELVTRPLAWLAKLISLLVHPLTLFFQVINLGIQIVKVGVGFIKDFANTVLDLIQLKMPSGGGGGTLLGWIKEVIQAVGTAVTQIADLIKQGKSITDAFNSVSLKVPKFPGLPELPDWMKGTLPDTIKLPGIGGFELPKFGSIFGGSKDSGGVANLTKSFENLHESAVAVGDTAIMNARLAIFDPEQGTEPKLLAETMERLAAFDLEHGLVPKGMEQNIANIRELEGGFQKLEYVMTGISENTLLGDGFAGIANIRELERGTELVTEAMTNAKDSGEGFMGVLRNIVGAVGEFFGLIEGEDIVKSLNFALLGTMGITAFKMFRNFSDVLGGVSDVIAGFKKVGPSVANMFNGVGDALSSFQTQARAELIKQIGIALLLLAGALLILSFIPREKMITALIGLGGALAIVTGTLVVLDKALKELSTAKLVAIGFAFAGIGLGLMAIATALLIFNYVDNDSIYRAGIVLGILFIGLEKIGKLAEKSGRKLVSAGIAIGLIGVSLGILAASLLLFKLVDNESLIKGAATIAVLTLALLALGLVPAARLAKAGTAMMAISVAMLLLANALIIFGTVQWESLAKAGVALAGLTLALILMSGMGAAGAAVILAVGAAMIGIAMACLIFNKVNWTAMAMAGVALLGLIVAFAAFMAIVSFFAPAIVILSVFAGSIAALALALALLGGVFLVLIPLSAVAATAFAAFAAAAAVAIAVFLQTLATEMPTIKNAMAKIIQGIVDILVDATPRIIDGLLDMLDAIIARADDFAEAAVQLVVALVEGLIRSIGSVVAAGVRLIIAFVNGIAGESQRIIDAGIDLLIKLANALVDNVFRLVEAGIDMMVDFCHQLADLIRNESGEIGAAVGDVVSALVELGPRFVAGIARGIAEAPLNALTGAINGVIDHIPGAAMVRGLISSPSRLMIPIGQFMVDGITKGIQNHAAGAIAAIASVVGGQIATSEALVLAYVQRMDQLAISARAKAEGLAKAAEKASKAAEKTKKEGDDKAAEKLAAQASKASDRADVLEERARRAEEKAEREREFREADTLTKAKMKSEDAENAIADAKAAEGRAGAALAEARALEAQAKSGKYAAAETKRMRAEADKLRKEAAKEAALANSYLNKARTNAGEALALQKQAGAEAALAFQKQFDAEALEDAEGDAFDKMTDGQKAAYRRQQAEKLQAQANLDLAAAKKLAYTNVEAANLLAQKAEDGAEKARDYFREAIAHEQAVKDAVARFQETYDADAKAAAEREAFEKMSTEEQAAWKRAEGLRLQIQAAKDLETAKTLALTDLDAATELAQKARDAANLAREYLKESVTAGPTVDLTASDQAALAFANIADMYNSAVAASAAGTTVEFNQYNTSPESLSPTEVYRQTNNLLTHAYERLGQAA